MAADVSSEQSKDKMKKELGTKDLLGGKSADEKDLWEKKFEFLSRKPNYTSKHDTNHVLHDINFSPPLPTISYSSICTLEKVKLALERAMRDPKMDLKSDDSTKRRAIEVDETNGQNYPRRMNGGSMMVTVCFGCFQYLLVPKLEPRCPKCDRHVPVDASGLSTKKARIDLNCTTSLDN